MSDRIIVERNGGVADVRLNRAEKMNALDPAMFNALVETSAELASDPTLRCVVLSGNGKSFCAGLDFGSFQRIGSAGSVGDSDSDADGDSGVDSDSDVDSDGGSGSNLGDIAEGAITHQAQQAVYGWTSMPVPVIAAVHGHALGGGIQLALGADIRVVAPDAKMSVLEIRWGLIPDMTGTQSLVNLVGVDVAKELTFTGRMVSGVEAARLGLATTVSDDPRADALTMAAEIAAKSPHAIRAAKRLFNEAPKVSVAEGFSRERAEIGQLIGSPNQVEQVMAFFEKRRPQFADPQS